jgi:hypothetical protein
MCVHVRLYKEYFRGLCCLSCYKALILTITISCSDHSVNCHRLVLRVVVSLYLCRQLTAFAAVFYNNLLFWVKAVYVVKAVKQTIVEKKDGPYVQ